MRIAPLLVSAACCFLAACSSIPDQKEATGLSLVEIVRNIRCETAEAVRKHHAGSKKDHVIAFGYDFESENKRGLAAQATTLTWPLTIGTVSLGIGAGVEGKQFGDEKVTVAEQFSALEKVDCKGDEALTRLAYPIVGTIGVSEVVKKYLILHALPTAAVTEFSRTLRFTVTWSGGLSPHWDIAPAGPTVSAGFGLSGERRDFHEVKISITPVVPEKTAKQIVADRTYYVKVLPGNNAPKAMGVESEPLIPRGISPVEAAKRRAADQIRDGRLNDAYRQIERELAPRR